MWYLCFLFLQFSEQEHRSLLHSWCWSQQIWLCRAMLVLPDFCTSKGGIWANFPLQEIRLRWLIESRALMVWGRMEEFSSDSNYSTEISVCSCTSFQYCWGGIQVKRLASVCIYIETNIRRGWMYPDNESSPLFALPLKDICEKTWKKNIFFVSTWIYRSIIWLNRWKGWSVSDY